MERQSASPHKLLLLCLHHGWDWLVWLYVAWGSFGSIMVGVVLYFADSILRGFGAAGASLIATAGSAVTFGFQLTPAFAVGAIIELCALISYSALGASASIPPTGIGAGGAPSHDETEDAALLSDEDAKLLEEPRMKSCTQHSAVGVKSVHT